MIRLGLNVPNFGPTTTPTALRAWIEFAEATGFSLAMMSDHVALTADVAAMYPAPFYDPFATLSWLASFTTQITLGTSVAILPYRHPLLTARMSANLDQFTAGRFVLGVGVGWSEVEYAALGVSFAERGRITDEYLTVITRAWTEARLSVDGEHVRFEDVATGPPPVRQPHPPLWVGGMGPTAIQRATRFADAWHPVNPGREWLQHTALTLLTGAAAAVGKPSPKFCPRIKARLTSRDVSEPDRPLGVGSLPQIRDDLLLLDDLGADVVVLDTNPDRPDQRQPAVDDWLALEKISACADEIVARHPRAEPGSHDMSI
jgi:probable F420-dependent oxidoreductase